MSWNQNIKRIIDVCEVIAGQSPEGKYYNKDGEGLPFYQGKKEFTDREIGEPTTWTKKTTKEAFSGDILMSVRAPVGPINLCTQHICIGRGLAAIRASEKVNRDYLFYYLLKHETEIVGNTGAVFNSINKSQIGNIPIPIPPLPEQQQIVTILDEAFEAIDQAKANIEKNIENAKELFQSKLNDIFSQKGEDWEEKRFGDVCHFVRGPFGGSLKKSCFVEDGYAVYEQQHAINDQFESIRYFVNDSKFDEMQRFELKSGDVIMSCSGTMGKVAIVPPNVKKGIINQALLKLTPNKNIDREFLKRWMESTHFLNEIAKFSKGAAIKNVASVKILKEIKLHLPQEEKQMELVEFIDNLDDFTANLIFNYETKKSDLEELKKSILQKAFAGELTNKTVEV